MQKLLLIATIIVLTSFFSPEKKASTIHKFKVESLDENGVLIAKFDTKVKPMSHDITNY